MRNLVDSMLKKDPNERITLHQLIELDEVKKAVKKLEEKKLTKTVICCRHDPEPI